MSARLVYRPLQLGRRAAVSALVLAAIVTSCSQPEETAAPLIARPNLVLISVDTLRPDRLPCYGGGADVGNAICSLAATGIRYTWAFSTAPSTPPSIASLHTSRLPRDHGVTEHADVVLPPSAVTLAETLAAGGYDTAAFVGNPALVKASGVDQGFAVYDDNMLRQERNRGVFEREAKELTDAALAWVGNAKAPWFLWIHYQDPHGPYEPPDAGLAEDPFDASADTLPVLPDQSGWHGIPAYQVLGAARVPATYERRYKAEIRYLDREVARLIADVYTRGDRPGILLTADHGEAFGEDDFWFAHGHSLAMDQIRIPMFWRPPLAQLARVVTTPVSNIDVAPTLLEAAGLPVPPSFDGVSLASREDGSSRTPIFAEHRLRIAVIAGGRYYARDRVPFETPVPEPISGGVVPPIPPRTATLIPDGPFEGYRSVDGEMALEKLVAAYLAQPPASRQTAKREIDEQTREALRALGYLE